MITVFVGDVDSKVADAALAFDSAAYFLNKKNFQQFLNLEKATSATVYTSHGDLPKITDDRAVLYEVLQKADTIYYIEPSQWSDYDSKFQITNQKLLTEYFLHLVNLTKKNVVNFTVDIDNPYIELFDCRKSNDKNIWAAGCSITNGVGVSSTERFSAIVAKTFDLPLNDLSCRGSSISFAADQILRSDIKKGDIVIWGLTQELRFVEFNSEKPGINFGDWASQVENETLMYHSVTSVFQVINFCRKVGAQLILLPFICTENLCLLLANEPDFYQLPYQTKPIDYGTDNLHPGPKQHKEWANVCCNIISNTAT